MQSTYLAHSFMISSMGTPLVSGSRIQTYTVMIATKAAKNKNTPNCAAHIKVGCTFTLLHTTQLSLRLSYLFSGKFGLHVCCWEGQGKPTCILQSMLLKNWPMMKLAMKLVNTVTACPVARVSRGWISEGT